MAWLMKFTIEGVNTAMDYDKGKEKGAKRFLKGGPRDQQIRLRSLQQPAPVVIEGSSSEAVAQELRNQIKYLTEALTRKPKALAEFTAEEVDDEIRKAVTGAVKETEDKYKEKMNKLTVNNKELEKEVERLKAGLASVKREAEFERKEMMVKLEAGYEKTIAGLRVSLEVKEKLIEDLKKEKSNDLGALTEKVRALTTSLASTYELAIPVDEKRPKMEEVFVDPLEKGAGENLESHVDIKDLSFKEKVKVDTQVDKLKGLIGKLPSIGSRK